MPYSFSKPLRLLSILIILLTLSASLGGLFIKGIYRDNAFVASTWVGTDFATLVVTIPLFIAAVNAALRGAVRAYLVCLGLFESSLYNYGFYLFGAAFNLFFLVYAAIFGLSIWALFLGLKNMAVEKIAELFNPKMPVKGIGIFMVFVGLGLSAVYLSQWLGFVFSGQVPPIVEATGHPTNVVFGLDLALVIPIFIAGGIWLWQRKPWGYALSVIATVKGAVYMAGLCAATLSAFKAGTIKNLSELAIWGTIGFFCLLSALILLANIKATKAKTAPN